MKDRLIILLLGITLSFNSWANSNVEEEVFLGLNGSTFISGETILYSAFVYAKRTGMPSPLSKILYVELLNEEGKVASLSKVKIEDGRGYGDIFIPSTFKTGSYRLVAYTRWMRNFNKTFHVPIAIVNPFETLDEKYLESTEIHDEDSGWEMNFDVTNAGIIKDLINTINYKIEFPNEEMLRFKGKVLDEAGEILAEFSSQNAAFGKIRITPKSQGPHHVVLEDERGGFHFFDLPAIVNEGVILERSDFGSFVIFTIQSTKDLYRPDLVTMSENGDEKRLPFTPEGSVKVPVNEMSPGLNRVLVQEEGKTITQTNYYLKREATTNNQELIMSEFATRQFASFSQSVPSGSYVVSVKKERDWVVDYRTSSVSYFELFSKEEDYPQLELAQYSDLDCLTNAMMGKLSQTANSEKLLKDSVAFLPELRGEILTGRIVDDRNLPLANRTVAYATVDSYQLSLSKTNDQGEFILNIYPSNEDSKTYISVFDTLNYHISINGSTIERHHSYEPIAMQFDSVSIAEIVTSSLHSQIENVYFDVKKDSAYDAMTKYPWFQEMEYRYVLDDYNRFKTVKETITEYIPYLAVRKKNGKEYIKVRQEGVFSTTYDPLILLDGVPVIASDALALSPYKIMSISGIPRRVYIGAEIFDGLILIETKEGNMHGWTVNPSYYQYTTKGLEKAKIYNFPDYENASLDRIPDQREQLYWNPNMTIDDGRMGFQFFTSDLEGEFVIEINGFSEEGKPIYITQQFSVK